MLERVEVLMQFFLSSLGLREGRGEGGIAG